MSKPRETLVQYLTSQLVGPAEGDDEVLYDFPHRRYLMGTLYPSGATTDELVETEEQEDQGSIADEIADDPIRLANEWMPQSAGLTMLVVDTGDIQVDIWAATYDVEDEERGSPWRRRALFRSDAPERITVRAPEGDRRRGDPIKVLGDRAFVLSYWRKLDVGYLVTIALINALSQPTGKPDATRCLYQVGFRCTPMDGSVIEYPKVERLSKEPDEEELRLLHRHARLFAIGHGCAARWPGEDDAGVAWVETDFMPRFEVPPLTAEVGDVRPILRLARLCDPSVPTETLARDLHEFVSDYETWIDALREANGDVPSSLSEAASRLIDRARTAAQRMRLGVDLLSSDQLVRDSFRLAQRVMLIQMRRANPDIAGTRRQRGDGVVHDPDYLSSEEYSWRPFQLAFQLLTLESLADSRNEYRDIVDLLWFPTGGGKTEAYLAVAAFEIFYRRMRNKHRGSGTAVITRYTLRLLTTQQFQRSCAMICASEILRRERSDLLGEDPISIGLWVGRDATPNTIKQARDVHEEILSEAEPRNAWQLERCPWCGTEIIPMRRDEDAASYGVEVTNSHVRMFCPTAACPFHGELPVSVVDEVLYATPPSFLIATVDKFAQLAWSERGSVFFGGKNDPPSLIIQDELHLLTGPLGTTTGVYETAIEALISMRGEPPKVIASTATIRRADEQVTGLFGKRVSLFPPAGLDARDSYFARLDEKAPGRLYLGVLSPSHTAPTATTFVAAALLEGVVEVGLPDNYLNSYWTLVSYHNTLRDLGKTMTLARDDIPARMRLIARDQAKMRRLGDADVVELTSNVSAKELPTILSRMSLAHSDPDAISFLASTNMVSVGVDVPRLGLMVVNGQPKSTSEYIQATSRVGRGSVPGLVVTLLRSTQPRDRSHYETFIPYHAALHRFVEPSSVTPFSLPSRNRALHAALVILMRHAAGLGSDEAAERFTKSDARVQSAVETLMQRVGLADPDELEATRGHVERLLDEWEQLISEAKRRGLTLRYKSMGKQHVTLLRDFGARGEGWETLNSMRNVDRQAAVTVLGEK